jgi:hypothetical protein
VTLFGPIRRRRERRRERYARWHICYALWATGHPDIYSDDSGWVLASRSALETVQQWAALDLPLDVKIDLILLRVPPTAELTALASAELDTLIELGGPISPPLRGLLYQQVQGA